jgi:hypothetical protein
MEAIGRSLGEFPERHSGAIVAPHSLRMKATEVSEMFDLLLHASPETVAGSALWFVVGVGAGAVLMGFLGHLARR